MPQHSENVVWFEGMALEPHHMQQWDRHRRVDVRARTAALRAHGWGLTALAFDPERLANGELALTQAAGLLPDGLPFDMPGHESLPAPRNVAGHFDASARHLTAYLALPAEQPGQARVTLQNDGAAGAHGANGRGGTRFTAATVGVADANTGTDERSIEVARPNFELRFDGEPMDAFTVLPVADLERAGNGFSLREAFVPPCLQFGASEHLVATTRRLLELLVSKSDAFADRRARIMSQRELSAADVNALGLLSTLSTYVPLLNDFLQNRQRHPEALFRVLLALTGQLTARVDDAPAAPRDLPAYQHGQLSECFGELEDALHGMLGAATPQSNYTRVSLREKRQGLLVGEVSERQAERAQFFLIARSDELDEDDLVPVVKEQLRVASADTIEAVLSSYTRALTVEHTARLPVDPQAHYFRLKKRGPFWEAIEDSGELAVFVPSKLESLSLELVTVENP